MSKKYKSYSKEDKLSLLRDYYQSGLSKNSFCKSRGIAAVKSLNTWLKVFANEKDLKVAISYITHPRDHISIAVEYLIPRMT